MTDMYFILSVRIQGGQNFLQYLEMCTGFTIRLIVRRNDSTFKGYCDTL